ncbi:MAG: bifunctional hydroxymethylpyrimidine kinase/phosphomethylpyrimidine kinase [Prevotella sp.]|nr:bifunctional hydroxymethylpyrimidine kinase/phosphomethylpyrimidine kinase [Prevotella sp.]
MRQTKPILTITGSDPTGGSGIQADIKTITALGGYAVSAITSVTVQTTLGIQQFHDLPAQVVAGQMEAVMNDVQPETVKVGLIRTVEAVRAIAEALTKYRPRHIVYAPSSQSSQGEALIPADVELAINQLLLPTCTVVLSDARFKSHGDINLYASAVAYYLNEGDNAEDAQRKARQFLNVQRAHTERLLSRGFELFDEFRQMVEAHFVESSVVSFYADRLNVSTSYLAQVTKRISGQAPKAFIDERIISEARRLLTSTSLTVQEISYQLGFTSQAHFTKYFKKLTGLTPSDFRSNP